MKEKGVVDKVPRKTGRPSTSFNGKSEAQRSWELSSSPAFTQANHLNLGNFISHLEKKADGAVDF